MQASLIWFKEIWFKEMKWPNIVCDCIFHKIRKYDGKEITLNPVSVLRKDISNVSIYNVKYTV